MDEVTVTVTNRKTGHQYVARSYPDDDRDNDGNVDYYFVPVYEVTISTKSQEKKWKGLRFMPYWNDSKAPSRHYEKKAKGFINSGLHRLPRQLVTKYDVNYGTSNRTSPYRGAIRVRDHFLIHAGPLNLLDFGWGSAGCVEIIGNFDKFKDDIRDLAGIDNKTKAEDAITSMVKKKKLYMELQLATPPDFRNMRVPMP